ncbi:uncharacterized protein B0I36DRAFT_291253 [Microdochium trichocladiopsis]|uniref:Uncharacterized protein n=1 Tax=Microdochium trichocladiopsis TaxID=1682393 RepID=A0A9P8Y4D4_9PEZI|nr:uncharacterized protein B0I36DRAFT_291253 [Microdochium trichocladiopsis]KAH7029508.1 hypothetical protein B0I36DRAFT_291253 [Microdochium trichocladiopsis]
MSSPLDTASRLRQLNPLTTALGGYHSPPAGVPQSAMSVASPYSGFSAVQTPASSVQPYNPQQWGMSPIPASDRPIQQFANPSRFQEDAHAPPPYSPPRQRPTGQGAETPPANISAVRIPASQVHRPSPEPQAVQNFPPPPGAAGRAISRERRFGLPSLGRRRDREAETASPPDAHPPTSLSRPQPLSIQVPQPFAPSRGEPNPLAPASRRAASASAIETPVSARSRSASQSRWAPGMPLPPPPPGPPPPQSRSQSLSRPIDPSPIMAPPTRRPPPSGVTALGPVPPTPANWVDETPGAQSRATAAAELTIDTESAANLPAQSPEESLSGSSSAGLSRAGAVRGGEKTIRERRNESRTRHTRGGSTVGALSDIVVPQINGVAGHVSVHKNTPRSGTTRVMLEAAEDADSRNSTPRLSAGMQPETPTSPYSPNVKKAYVGTPGSGRAIAPKALPTPPPGSRSALSSSQVQIVPRALSTTPVSARPANKIDFITQTPEQFCNDSIERFQMFAQMEAQARNDADRVKLFSEFIVNESRIRRERYSTAIGAMGSEIFDLTRDLFRPMKTERRDSTTSQPNEWTPNTEANHTRDLRTPGSAPGSAGLSEGSPASNATPGPQNRDSRQYHPSLSPILSMSVSETHDDEDSRGRPASRWWESDSVGDGASRLERSKRESKYMGVSRESLQWLDGPGSAGPSSAGPSAWYPSNEYPPEKVGWHETESASTPQPFRNSLLSIATPTPHTPSPLHLDISRLVTLPPPYPRHHPAVNNNHPDLTAIRTQVRLLSDMTDIKKMKDEFLQESQKMREEAAAAAAERRQTLRENLQRELSSGGMSYADAAAIEADSQENESAQAKDVERKDFDRFQTAVVIPVNEMLTERITQASGLLDELKSQLFVSDPDMPQEEGDEKPEVLEKLTLLKWIFEARETLHREIYELLSDRNDRYREMVLMPYRLAKNEEKLQNAVQFFADDAQKRKIAFTGEVLQRTREFRGIVEENVNRGVDMQLNAFWDIAPPLMRVLDKIPGTITSSFRIHIPPSEYEENPEYNRHPLQYLHSLLTHAEKSTYQFIESQTNLQCLLHEVKEAVMIARTKNSEVQGREAHAIEQDRKAEEEYLAQDLKEKVRVVQEQWQDGLGNGMSRVKERVGTWLIQTGGWDDTLEEGGVGGV